jgi:biotin carboxylase
VREFEGKKLLIMGGNPETLPLVQTAQKLGAFVIVTDDNPNALSKQSADKSYNINGLDVPGIVALAKAESVDGVLVGVADILIDSYQRVCKKLGFPCYANVESVECLTKKDKFIQRAETFGMHGIPQYSLDCENIPYPVLVKPVDNGGGVGITLCSNHEELLYGIENAIQHSRSGKYRIEKYMTCDDTITYYTFKGGKYYVSAMADRYTARGQNRCSPVCLAAIYPSKHYQLYLNTMHDKMLRFFESIHLENGILLVQAFVENDTFYLYDPGFRLQGEAPHLHMAAANGFDHREMLVRFALTGSMGKEELEVINDPLLHGKHGFTLWILLKQGKIGSIKGLNEVKNDESVVQIVQRLHPGDTVEASMLGNEKQVLARIYIQCGSHERLMKKVQQIESSIDVMDSYGNNQIQQMFDLSLLS